MIVISRSILPYVRSFWSYFGFKPKFLTLEMHNHSYTSAELSRLIAHAKQDERERIARDLHDQVGQDIACLTMALHLLKPHAASPEAAEKLADVLELTDGLAQNLHRLVVDIRQSEIEVGALVPMLRTMAAEWSDRAEIPVDVTVGSMEGRRSPAIETALFRVCQECLTNVAKHAATARRVGIELHCTKKEIILSIADDGPGFRAWDSGTDEIVSNRNRHGIVGMRERLEILGGTITITSTPPVGTLIVAKTPLWEG